MCRCIMIEKEKIIKAVIGVIEWLHRKPVTESKGGEWYIFT